MESDRCLQLSIQKLYIQNVALTKILVLRFSAMGDVVLLVPVIRSFVTAYPDVEVTIVTRPKFASFFTNMERVVPFPADVDHTYNGILGMRELFKKFSKKRVTMSSWICMIISAP